MIEVEIENDCVGCPQGCINCGRRYARYAYFACDRCKNEVEELYYEKDTGDQLCIDCVMEQYEKINDLNYDKYIS